MDRPTLIPDFDPADFARDSEIRQTATAAGGGDALDVEEARRLHFAGEHERALFVLTRVLSYAPFHPEAGKLASECREALERECLAAIGSEEVLLVAGEPAHELKSHSLDKVSAFLISLVDGPTSVGDLVDISGLPRLLALRHLRGLLERGIVCVASGQTRPPPRERPSLPGWYGELEREDEGPLESGVHPWPMAAPTLDAIPVLLVAAEDLDRLELEAGARTLLARVDDLASVKEILAALEMDLGVGVALLERLAHDGIVAFV